MNPHKKAHRRSIRRATTRHRLATILGTALSGCWLMMAGTAAPALAEDLGSVDTKFNLLSPDDSINVAFFEDPAVTGITCYLSRAQKGGYRGALGLAEDTSDASIDCRQTGPISFTDTFSKGDQVFRERRSLVFKSLKVVRFCDTTNNALVYLAYSDKVIEGSPKNSISAVPLRPWVEAASQNNTAQPSDSPTPQVTSTKALVTPTEVTVQPAPACRYEK